jgi:hypothetical protein
VQIFKIWAKPKSFMSEKKKTQPGKQKHNQDDRSERPLNMKNRGWV